MNEAELPLREGISATNDLDAVLATEPECVVYCAMADNRMGRAMKDVRRILAAGIIVVGSAPVPVQYPWPVLPDQYIAPLQDAARQAGSSLFITGVDPDFVNDLIPFAFASTCQTVEQVRCTEIADYAIYDGAAVMVDVMGFGKPLDETPLQLQPGLLAMAWGSSIRQMAAGLCIDLDEISEAYDREPAPEAFDIAAGHIPKGGQAAVRCEIRGWSRHTPRSSSSMSPGCERTCAQTGRNPRSPAAPIASKSSASRPTPWSSAPPAARAITTTPQSLPRRDGS
jgi:hypothetical protein